MMRGWFCIASEMGRARRYSPVTDSDGPLCSFARSTRLDVTTEFLLSAAHHAADDLAVSRLANRKRTPAARAFEIVFAGRCLRALVQVLVVRAENLLKLWDRRQVVDDGASALVLTML